MRWPSASCGPEGSCWLPAVWQSPLVCLSRGLKSELGVSRGKLTHHVRLLSKRAACDTYVHVPWAFQRAHAPLLEPGNGNGEGAWAPPQEVTWMTRHLPALWPLPVFAVLLLAIGLLGPKMLASSLAPSATAAPTPAGLATLGSAGAAAPISTAVTAASSTQFQGTAGAAKRTVLGYYVPYDATSWASFQAQAAALDYVDAQWVTADACGNVGSRDDRTLIAY